jgi:hypothetical protein
MQTLRAKIPFAYIFDRFGLLKKSRREETRTRFVKRNSQLAVFGRKYMNKTLSNLQREVRALHAEILAECGRNSALKEIYKGCQIYYNKLYPQQDIMLLGINPGGGFWRANRQLAERFEPIVDENFDLAVEVKSVFQELGKPGLYEKSFRTNCYFFATDSESKLKQFLQLLPKQLRAELDIKSRQWIKIMVTQASPKIIICEGISAYHRLLSAFYPDREIVEEGPYTKIARLGGKPVLAFKRMYCYFYSTASKKDFIDKLGEYLQM